MKLPDYSKCVNLNHLLVAMGVKEVILFEIPPITFTRTKVEIRETHIPNPELKFAERMQKESIPLEGNGFDIADDGTLEVNGVKCTIYIKDQRRGIDEINNTSTYRYHLANCKTIQYMHEIGRYNRYVATSREDGLFAVNNQMFGNAHENILKLELCHNCREILINTGKHETPFSLRNFFNKYQTKFPATLRREEQVVIEEQYSPNHDEIAKQYKRLANYTCQQCNVYCQGSERCLHLHHVDGDGQNNKHDNLRVLCVDCHSKQPLHTQIRNNKNFRDDCKMINELRKQQKLHHII